MMARVTRMILLAALALFAGCKDNVECPVNVVQDGSCSPEGLYCLPTFDEGTCTCTSGRFHCSSRFQVHDLAVPDLAIPRDLSPSTD